MRRTYLIAMSLCLSTLALYGCNAGAQKAETQKESASQIDDDDPEVKRQKEWIENFYLNVYYLMNSSDEDRDKLDAWVRKHTTARAQKDLVDLYPYDIYEEEIMASWYFFYDYRDTADIMLKRTIECVAPNTFLITHYWGCSDETIKVNPDDFVYQVKLELVKAGQSYKINRVIPNV